MDLPTVKILKENVCQRWNELVFGYDNFPQMNIRFFNILLMEDENFDNKTLNVMLESANGDFVKNMAIVIGYSGELIDDYFKWVKFLPNESILSPNAAKIEEILEVKGDRDQFLFVWNAQGIPEITYQEIRSVPEPMVKKWLEHFGKKQTIDEMNGAWSVLRHKTVFFTIRDYYQSQSSSSSSRATFVDNL